MRFTSLSGTALAVASTVMAKEMPKDETRAKEMYDSGAMHEKNVNTKVEKWMAAADAGAFDSSGYPRLNYTKCQNGVVEAIPGDPMHTFKCKNIDLYDFINHATLGSPNGWDELGDGTLLTGSSSWGWTDPDSGREFIASGMYDGTAFLEILPEGRFVQLGFLPMVVAAEDVYYRSFWKELRAYKNYMLIGSEQDGHGIQIFDMSKLLDIDESDAPFVFDAREDVTGLFDKLPIGASHNVVVNEELSYGAAVGARPRTEDCMGGLIFFDLTDPSNPEYLGCNGDDGYVHDAQCIVYRGPDEKYHGRDVCYGYNEDTLTIYDVTDKANSTIISITSYEGATFTHQGWVNDPQWQEWIFMNDELDELNQNGPAQDEYPVTFVWDIRDLENPKQTGLFKGTVPAVDHNLYIHDGLLYQSNYMAGYRVYDASSIPDDPSGDSVCEIAYLDIYPEDDDDPRGGVADMYGSWSSYAMFPSGFITINTIERGLYLAKMTRREKCPVQHKCNADNCLRAMRASHIDGRLGESQEFCEDFTATVTADVGAVPTYAADACGVNIISRVSSACSCLPKPTAA